MTRVIAIRPEPGLSSTLELGRDLGLDIIGAPLFEVRARQWDCPDPAAIDALLIGSANAVLHGGEHLGRFIDKPVHAVGKATADAAREVGFTVASVGSGGLQNVLDDIPPRKRLLRVAGAEHVPLNPPEGVSIHTVIAYESAALPLPENVMEALREPAIVLLHSAAAARHFASECDRLSLSRNHLAIAALGPRIAEAAGEGWAAIHTPAAPNDRDLLEMVAKLCL